MDILSPLDKTLTRKNLAALVNGSSQKRRFAGDVSEHQFVIRLPRERFSLPWRATFRGAMIPLAGGTLITGKFDSNWSLYFVGYPILYAVVLNVVINVLTGNTAGRGLEFSIFLAYAGLQCVVLQWIDRRGKQRIAESLRVVVRGKISDHHS